MLAINQKTIIITNIAWRVMAADTILYKNNTKNKRAIEFIVSPKCMVLYNENIIFGWQN